MNIRTTRASALLLLVCMVVSAGVGALAAARAVPTRPATVGIVNLESVFNQSHLWANRQADLKDLETQLDTELTARRDKVKELEDELTSFVPGSASAVKLQAEVNTAVSEFTAFKQWATLRLEAARAKSLRATYEEIQKSAKAFAQKYGIDIVLVDDSIPGMTPGSSANTVQQISARRVLFATEEFDISDDLLAELNGAHPLRPGVTVSATAGSGASSAKGQSRP